MLGNPFIEAYSIELINLNTSVVKYSQKLTSYTCITDLICEKFKSVESSMLLAFSGTTTRDSKYLKCVPFRFSKNPNIYPTVLKRGHYMKCTQNHYFQYCIIL